MKFIEPIESEKILKKEVGEINNCQQAVSRFIYFFENFKVKKKLDHKDEDMLLFQYGTYGDNRLFEFNLTRQFEIPDEDEFLQLGLSLFYDEKDIGIIKSFNSWSATFDNLKDWQKMIESTEGYEKAKRLNPMKMKIFLCGT